MNDADNDHGKIQEHKYRRKEPTQKVEGTVILFKNFFFGGGRMRNEE